MTDPLEWLLGLERLGMKFGLENMTRLVSELGHPERHFLCVHIAGTNGKGSVTAMLESALHHAGHRSARYTSPHLERLEERFVVGSAEVDTVTLRSAVEKVRTAVIVLQEQSSEVFAPTFFECATAAAFVLFRDAGVEIAAIETGLGGRLDATNVVGPVATAITSIDFDHEALLGGTLRAIAREKAGIIKPGVPLVLGPVQGEPEKEILAAAAERGTEVLRGRDLPRITPALRGGHQRDNIAVTVALADVLNGRGVRVPEASLRYAIEHVKWPGRLEYLVSGDQEFLLDAAHNAAGARALAAYLRETSWTDAVLVFGALADKNVEAMLAGLAPAVAAIVCTTPRSARAAPADELAAIARSRAPRLPVHVEPDPVAALTLARRLSRRVIVAGSIFLVGPLRGILR